MTHKAPKRATKGEREYIRDLERTSAFDLVDRSRGRILTSEEYPEPLKRFLRRERMMVHVKLSAAAKRKLEARSRESGIPADELARAWIEQGIRRDAG
ncbi:MAG: hypothetical protein V3W34_17455 [Phycisphaerae bacterium]